METRPTALRARVPRQRRPAMIGVAIAATAALVVTFGLFAAAGGAASKAVPSNSTPPTISGTTQQGSTLTVNQGTWTGTAPISYGFQWLRCDTSGASCSAIIGETATTYLLKGVDLGTTLRVVVTGSNAEGTNTATTVPTGVVVTAAQVAPVNASPPTISGLPQDGKALLVNRGTWNGTAPLDFSYRWLRCDKKGASCAAVGGTTTQTTHLVVSADVGNTLRAEVTAKNAAGSKSVNTAPTAIVIAGAPTTGCSKNGGVIPVTSIAPPARLTIDQFQVNPSPITYGSRYLTARFHVSACGGPVQGALVYAAPIPYGQFSTPSEQATDASGWATIQLSALAGFPVSSKQQLLVLFVRARKSGDNLLGGISSRRLVSFNVHR